MRIENIKIAYTKSRSSHSVKSLLAKSPQNSQFGLLNIPSFHSSQCNSSVGLIPEILMVDHEKDFNTSFNVKVCWFKIITIIAEWWLFKKIYIYFLIVSFLFNFRFNFKALVKFCIHTTIFDSILCVHIHIAHTQSPVHTVGLIFNHNLLLLQKPKIHTLKISAIVCTCKASYFSNDFM